MYALYFIPRTVQYITYLCSYHYHHVQHCYLTEEQAIRQYLRWPLLSSYTIHQVSLLNIIVGTFITVNMTMLCYNIL